MAIVLLSTVVLVAAAVYCGRLYFIKHRLRISWNPLPHAGTALIVAGAGMVVVSAGNLIALQSVVPAFACLVLIAACDAVDFTSFRYFGNSILANFRYLPLNLRSRNLPKDLNVFVRTYFPKRYFLLTLATLVLLLLIDALLLPFGPMGLWSGALGIAAGILVLRFRGRVPDVKLSAVEHAFLLADDNVAAHPLRHADRRGSFELAGNPALLPRTILIVINESAGGNLPASDDPDLLLADRIRQLSGDFDTWFAPVNAITNSSCTDVIIPSILTGAAPHESADKLHRMPFIFDLAKARGYRTAFFTSSTLEWANLGLFFRGAEIDELFTADTSGRPYVNDLTIDDYIPARELADRLRNSEGRFLAVLYSNALHVPFQSESECAIPDTIVDRRSRAIYLIERQHELLFDAMKRSGRFEDALIVVIGDHGEVIGEPGAEDFSQAMRLTELHDCVVRPLFLVKPPAGMPRERAEALAHNADRLVAHVDIAPSIAHVLGTRLTQGLCYAGCSLFDALPQDRNLYVLNINEWRSWSRGAVGIFRDRSAAIVDYMGGALCRYRGEDPEDSPDQREDLLAKAFKEPLVQKAISRIYKDRLGLAAR